MYYHSFNPTGLLAVTCGCNVQAHLGRSQIPFKHARTTRVKLLRAEAFTQGSFAHGKPLRRGTCTERIGFTQRSVYTEKVLHRETCYTKEPLDKGNFTPSNVLHTEAFTQSSSYTERLLHRASLYTERLLHRDAFTQITWYPEKLLQRKLCHREAVTQR